MLRYTVILATLSAGSCAGCVTDHYLEARRHRVVNYVPVSRVDEAFAEMGNILQTKSSPNDETANVSIHRTGEFGEVSVGNGFINDSKDANEVHQSPGNLKLVAQINACGTLNPNIAACATDTGKSIISEPLEYIVAEGSESSYLYSARMRASTWLHELGHNQGLQHRNDILALMHQNSSPWWDQINATEAVSFRIVHGEKLPP